MPASRAWWGAIGLGVAGLLANMVEVPLGWGLHFLFGNAIALLGLRLLGSGPTFTAVALASGWTFALWLHPWSWLVWSLEGLALATLWRRAPPLIVDFVFWILVGGPLLLVTYGGLMGMDGTSLGLVIAKQTINGLANVLIAELLYLAILAARPLQRLSPPPVSAQAATLTILLTFTLVPALLFLSIDSREREREILRHGRANLASAAETVDATLATWMASRQTALLAVSREVLASGRPTLMASDLGLLADEFESIFVFDAEGRVRSRYGDRGGPPSLTPERFLEIQRAGVRLSDIHRGDGNREPHLDLTMPIPGIGAGIYATVNVRVFGRAFRAIDSHQHAVSLVDRKGVITAELGAGDATARVRRALDDGGVASLSGGPHLLTSHGIGTSLMASYRDVVVVEATSVDAMPGWTIVGAFLPTEAILAARWVQLRLFLAIAGFVAIATVVAIWIAGRIGSVLSQMANAAVRLIDRAPATNSPSPGSVEELAQIRRGVRFAGAAIRSERESTETYRRQLDAILRHAPVILYALSLEEGRRGHLDSLNGSIERILGFSEAEARQPGWWNSAIHPDDAGAVRAAFAQLSECESVSHEYRLRGRDGRYRWVFNTLVATKAADGRAAEATGVLIDITDRKEAQLQLLQAAKLASLGEMATGIAHELNQPLSIIKLAATNLANRARAGELPAGELRERLGRIVGQVDRAGAVISHMRIFGRKTSESAAPMQVEAAIGGAASMVQQQLRRAGIQVVLRVADRLPPVLGHVVLLEQVLINLLLNAADAIAASIEAGRTTSGRIELAAVPCPLGVRISVEDNGVGIAEDSLERVFEPFYTTKPVNKGTGLGLSISYGILRDMGATIVAANARNGAVFTIELPALGNAEAPGVRNATASAGAPLVDVAEAGRQR
ncbi:hypothetical protein STVA_23080 [Allostella vacuolata]|nr:hypothetical protein STVA_23080 [Stella vacuolata]